MTVLSQDYLLGRLRNQTFAQSSRFYPPSSEYGHHFPMFTMPVLRTMLLDPRIIFGLSLIKGPISSYTKFFNAEEAESPNIHTAIVELNYYFPYTVRCDNEEQGNFILDQLKRLWNVAIFKILQNVEYGWSGCEVVYKQNKKKQLVFDNMVPYHPYELNVVVKNGHIIGFRRITDNSGFVPLGKGFWSLHKRETNLFYGDSRLRGAHIPWHETWMIGGARDIRRTWFFKCAYDGGEIYYPEGSWTDAQGVQHLNEEIAVNMSENKRTGSTAIFPSTKGLDGKKAWELVPPTVNMTPQGLMEYPTVLRDEELEGLGIPPEIVQNGGSQGMGAATGRMVPLQAFIATLSPLVSDIIIDFQKQVIDPILLVANKFNDDYTIEQIVPKTVDALGAQNGEPVTPKTEKTVPNSGIK